MGNTSSEQQENVSTDSNTNKNNTGDTRNINTNKKNNWTLPSFVDVHDIMSDNAEKQQYFCECLRNHGYALLTMENKGNSNTNINNKDNYATKIAADIAALCADRNAYFNLPRDVKEMNKEDDGIVRYNLGYVSVEGVREYLKLRPNDPEKLWPKNPSTFAHNWHSLFDDLKEIGWKLFLQVAKYNDGSSGSNSKLSDAKTLQAIEEFVGAKSSMSLIHYYPVTNEDLQCVCEPHQDTGLITFGVCSEVPGLVIWDSVKQDWVEIEKHCKPGDLVVFVGQKVPLFSGSDIWHATEHKVVIAPGVERNSLVFLLDVAK